jgi:hypothetical protein
MAKGWKLGHVYKYNGEKVVVTAINSDGTLTLNHAAGSGKTGYAGKVANPDAVTTVNADSFNVPEADVEGEGVNSYEDYLNASDNTPIGVEVEEALSVGDTLVTHNSRNVGKILRIDDKAITQRYLERNFPDFDGEYVAFAIQYEMDTVDKDNKPVTDVKWTTVVELTEGGITRRYVIERNKDDDEE